LVEEEPVVVELEGVIVWLKIAVAVTVSPFKPMVSVDGALVRTKVPVME
jgi:hypothetical protein